MGFFLNGTSCLENFLKITRETYFVDKSQLVAELFSSINIDNRFICVTRPRRFGKSVAANMIASFFGNNNSDSIFDKLIVSKNPAYKEHLNQHNVIFIDFSQNTEKSYPDFISKIQNTLFDDLESEFRLLRKEKENVLSYISRIHYELGEKFIFVFDEWDAPFRFKFMSETDKQSYIDFLHILLKGQSYVELAYMTGILPIKKYSSSSDLNMFLDYSLATQERYSAYFGFTEKEVDELYEKYQKNHSTAFTRDELRYWYDGYTTNEGNHIYNPRSVVLALSNEKLANYWTSSGPADEIFDLLKINIDDTQKSVARMVAGETIECLVDEDSINTEEITSKEEIFSAMVVYGLLTTDGTNRIKIPNYEILQKFDGVLRKKKELGYIARLAQISSEVLEATLNLEGDTVAELLESVHDSETPLFSYNRENELTAVVNLVYLAARDNYFVTREDKAGKGFTDFIFTPKNPNDDCIILELKVDSTTEEALNQILAKNYPARFLPPVGEKTYYKGRILLVAISYSKKEKKHFCKIEEFKK